MSETPAKVTRIELMTEGVVSEMEVETNEGEEWLSEELTDDDCVKEQDNSASISNMENTSQDESTMNSAISEQDQTLNEAEIAEMDMTHSQNDSVESHEDINDINERKLDRLIIMMAAQDNDINAAKETLQNMRNMLQPLLSRWEIQQEIIATSAGDQQPSTNKHHQDTEPDQQVVTTDQQDTTNDQQVTTSDQPKSLTDQQILSNVKIRHSTDDTDFDDLADDLSTFLIRKSDGAIIETQKDISDDDGNDTDDLLRVLGDDDKGKKPKKPVSGDKKPVFKSDKKPEEGDDSTDEDIFGSAKQSNMKLAKDMITRKAALKQRKRSITDQSTDDERSSSKKSKPVKRAVATKSTTKLPTHNSNAVHSNARSRLRSYAASKEKRVQHATTPVRLIRTQDPNASKSLLKPQSNKPPSTSTPAPQSKMPQANTPASQSKKYQANTPASQSKKSQANTPAPTPQSKKSHASTRAPLSNNPPCTSTPAPLSKKSSTPTPKFTPQYLAARKNLQLNVNTKNTPQYVERTRILSRKDDKAKETDRVKTGKKDVKMVEEFLDEDELGLNTLKSNDVTATSRTADGYDEFDEPNSEFDDESLNDSLTDYDELLSSNESEMDDWFTLDLRAERAPEYLPLLGLKALEMLNAEKERVTAKLETLKENALALSNNGKKQTLKILECRNIISDLEVQMALV